MKDRLLLCLLVGFGGALLALTACSLLLDIQASTGVARITRVNELAVLLVVSAPGSRSNSGAAPDWETSHVHYDYPEEPAPIL
jgi:hypothetical protein